MNRIGTSVKRVFVSSTIIAPVKNVLVGDRWITFDLAQQADTIYQVQGISQDGADWLTSLIRAGGQPYLNFQQLALKAFAKNSLCGIDGCQRPVEVGAHMTFGGDELLIVPSCQWHNAAGRLKHGAHIKLHQLYASVHLNRGDVLSNKDGTYTLGKVKGKM